MVVCRHGYNYLSFYIQKIHCIDKKIELRQNRSMLKILVINGPNLNLLGYRIPAIYGKVDLATINQALIQQGKALGYQIICFQSNAEHELIDRIQQAMNEKIAFIIFNPAAFTHTSIALRDTLLAVDIPFIEVHISNIHRRESFRHISYFSDIAHGSIIGLGQQCYMLALNAIHYYLSATE